MSSTNYSKLGFQLVSWLLLAVVVVMTLGPVSMRPHTHFSPDFDRFAAYALLGGFYRLAYPRCRFWILAAFLVAAAGTLEAAQLFVPGRDAHVSDFVFKADGAMIGLIAVRLLPQRPKPTI
jgi:VanZ family protein